MTPEEHRYYATHSADSDPGDLPQARLDAVAALTGAVDGNWTALREIYDREDAFTVPRVVMNFPKGVPIEIDLGA